MVSMTPGQLLCVCPSSTHCGNVPVFTGAHRKREGCTTQHCCPFITVQVFLSESPIAKAQAVMGTSGGYPWKSLVMNLHLSQRERRSINDDVSVHHHHYVDYFRHMQFWQLSKSCTFCHAFPVICYGTPWHLLALSWLSLISIATLICFDHHVIC